MLLKRIVIFVILKWLGRRKRKDLVEKLTSKSRKQNYLYNVDNIPAVLDDVKQLPPNWKETISFNAFDSNGICARLLVERNKRGCQKATLDLDIPSYGCFKYDEKRALENHKTDADDLCDGVKLKLFCQQAMVRWRIYLRGSLINVNDGEQSRHAIIALYWTCLFDPYDHFAPSNIWIRARHLSFLSWAEIFANAWDEDRLCYEQIGELRGRILIENHEELDVRLRCVRERFFSITDSADNIEKVYSEHIVVEETGLTLSNSFINLPDSRIAIYGYVAFPYGETLPVESTIQERAYKEQIRQSLSSSHDYVDHSSKTYNIVPKFTRPCFSDSVESTLFVKCSVTREQEKAAFGLLQRFDAKVKGEHIPEAVSSEEDEESRVSLDQQLRVVSLEEKICTHRQLVGGKAANLSLLKQSGAFNIPSGVCLTLNAFREHVEMHSDLKKCIADISRCISNGQATNVQETCDHAIKCLERIQISSELVTDILNELSSLYEEDGWHVKKFAVRSSGECEDGVQLSTAGQMDTFLGVHGLHGILDAVKKCWASAIAYRVVEYRRQNGQSLVEGMGVLVQEMVDADTAGVLFTSDLLTGNDAYMVINASFGLGEAVVSGQVNPDTIRVRRGRNNDILIENLEIGEKLTKIVASDDAGTKAQRVTDAERSKACLSQDKIKLLCVKGSEIESLFGSSQDIEWAFSQGELYILQTRPITEVDSETDQEIIHEFDRPVVNSNLCFTSANIREVLPGAASPLTVDFGLPASNTANRRLNKARLSLQCPVYATRHISTFAGVPLFCWTTLTLTITMLMGDEAKEDMEMDFMGEIAKEHTLQTIKDYYGKSYPSSLGRILILLKILLRSKQEARYYETVKKKVETFKIGEDATSCKDLFRSIDENIAFFDDTFYAFILKSMLSGTWAHIVQTMLKGETTDSMADLALVLSGCKDVCSAEVPDALNNLAELIAESKLKELFLETDDQDCDDLIRNSDNTALKTNYMQFLESHGHRCIREAELYAKSWRQDPSPLMRSLKMIVKNGGTQEKARYMTIDETVDSLKTPLSYIKKTLLKRYLVKKARHGIGQREEGKSMYIKVNDIFKQAYWRLAAMMVREGRLPDERLLFFLRHSEIGKLIDTRSVRLVRLAKHRLRLWPEMNKIKYPKISIGRPQPIQDDQTNSLGHVFTLKGMPVCIGRIEGIARVVKCVENADEIREGEILICEATDIGWSPYFCLIRGLVTELGGVVSHGAVIARECGIPCIVNVSSATDLIKTGDRVLLDGAVGTVCKLES